MPDSAPGADVFVGIARADGVSPDSPFVAETQDAAALIELAIGRRFRGTYHVAVEVEYVRNPAGVRFGEKTGPLQGLFISSIEIINRPVIFAGAVPSLAYTS